jgi:hypothetical protein
VLPTSSIDELAAWSRLLLFGLVADCLGLLLGGMADDFGLDGLDPIFVLWAL